MEGLMVSEANLVVCLQPSKNDEVYQAILRELSSFLFTFSEIFDGVVLSYTGVNFLDKCAKILPGVHPYFAVRLKAKFLVFSPKPNMLLEGKVVKLTQGSIHVIVLGFASAIITEEDIREEFVHITKHGQDVYASRSHKRHMIKVGTTIRFLVKSFDEEILHIFGSVIPDHTGSIHWLDKNLEDISPISRNAKKTKESEGESIMIGRDSVGRETFPMDNVEKVKKSKKQRIGEEY